MKYRVYFEEHPFTTKFFKTKKEAVEYKKAHGGDIQRKVGCSWYGY